MASTVTPKEPARELGVSALAIRRWLRALGWQSVPYTRWHLSEDEAAKVRARFENR